MDHELSRGCNIGTWAAKYAPKLELHRAFGPVSWDFLFDTLERLYFPPVFINWIKTCLCTTKFLIKINGMLNGYLSGAKGLRQGYLVSPSLFTLAMNYSLLSSQFSSKRVQVLLAL